MKLEVSGGRGGLERSWELEMNMDINKTLSLPYSNGRPHVQENIGSTH